MKLDWFLWNKKWLRIPYTHPVSEGAHGVYIQLSKKRGIKILVNEVWNKYEQHKTLKELKSSTLWKSAKEEVDSLKKAHKSKLTPKVFLLTYIYNELGNFYPAIVMEHIKGIPLYKAQIEKFLSEKVTATGRFISKFDNKPKNKLDWQDYVFDKFNELGLIHEDLSESNCLVTTSGQLKVIDLGLVSKKIRDK